MNDIIKQIKSYATSQKVWLGIILIIIGLFTYGEITATRLFTTTTTEDFKPSGSNSHGSHNSIHHK